MIIVNVVVTLTQQPLVFQHFFFSKFCHFISDFLPIFLYGVYRIYRDQIPYSKANAFAIVLVCLTFIHDYLLGLKLIDSVEIAFYSSCVYFMVITLQLTLCAEKTIANKLAGTRCWIESKNGRNANNWLIRSLGAYNLIIEYNSFKIKRNHRWCSICMIILKNIMIIMVILNEILNFTLVNHRFNFAIFLHAMVGKNFVIGFE